MMELIPEEEQTTLRAFYDSRNSVLYDGQRFGVEPYTLAVMRQGGSADLSDYHFAAPTTCSNLKRVLRALQLHKPILLEGSPGVGKTSLIMAVAQVIGQPIVRVNLSEQTDMADLLGSDLPVPAGEQATDEAGNSLKVNCGRSYVAVVSLEEYDNFKITGAEESVTAESVSVDPNAAANEAAAENAAE